MLTDKNVLSDALDGPTFFKEFCPNFRAELTYPWTTNEMHFLVMSVDLSNAVFTQHRLSNHFHSFQNNSIYLEPKVLAVSLQTNFV